MTKGITIVLSVTFIGILVIVAIITWHKNATAQPPWESPQPPFPEIERSAICATNDYVYVLSGNTLYQFNAADLKLVNKTTIEREPRFQPGKPDIIEDRFPPSRKRPEGIEEEMIK